MIILTAKKVVLESLSYWFVMWEWRGPRKEELMARLTNNITYWALRHYTNSIQFKYKKTLWGRYSNLYFLDTKNEVKQFAHGNMTKLAGLKAERFAYFHAISVFLTAPEHHFPKDVRKSSPERQTASKGGTIFSLLVPKKNPRVFWPRVFRNSYSFILLAQDWQPIRSQQTVIPSE